MGDKFDKLDWMMQLGFSPKMAIAGLAGGICTAVLLGQATPRAILGSVAMGLFTANYLGPVAFQYLGTWIGDGGSGFAVGLGATPICQRLVSAAQSWKPKGARNEKPTS